MTCLYLSRKIKGKGCVTFPCEIASYSIFAKPGPSSLLNHVCEPILSMLEQADRNASGDLQKTLEKYLECDKSITDAASELFIHRNTLSNRLEKISDITSIDFNNRELALCLRLALRQKRIQAADLL